MRARQNIAKCDIQSMKTVLYSNDALNALRKHRSDAKTIMAKIERYAATGAGKVTDLVGRSGKRLRVGDFRVLFEEDATTIRVSRIGPRGEIYD